LGAQLATKKKRKKIKNMYCTDVALTSVIIEKNSALCNCTAALLGYGEDDLMHGMFPWSVGWYEKKPLVFLILASGD
jgi:hypothetical protein